MYLPYATQIDPNILTATTGVLLNWLVVGYTVYGIAVHWCFPFKSILWSSLLLN